MDMRIDRRRSSCKLLLRLTWYPHQLDRNGNCLRGSSVHRVIEFPGWVLMTGATIGATVGKMITDGTASWRRRREKVGEKKLIEV